MVLIVDQFIVDQFRQGEDKEKIALYSVHFSLFIQELLKKIKDEVCFGVLKGRCKSDLTMCDACKCAVRAVKEIINAQDIIRMKRSNHKTQFYSLFGGCTTVLSGQPEMLLFRSIPGWNETNRADSGSLATDSASDNLSPAVLR